VTCHGADAGARDPDLAGVFGSRVKLQGGGTVVADELYVRESIMTPTAKTNQVAKEKIKHLWTKIGAKVEFLSPEEHDKILAYVSHLPHLLAYGLMETIPQEFLGYALQGLKDSTRIAASSPQMWNDVCMANSRNVLNALDELVKHLCAIRKAVINHDEKNLVHHFAKAKEKRDSLNQIRDAQTDHHH
jgi:prephenate dehydrogenase